MLHVAAMLLQERGGKVSLIAGSGDGFLTLTETRTASGFPIDRLGTFFFFCTAGQSAAGGGFPLQTRQQDVARGGYAAARAWGESALRVSNSTLASRGLFWLRRAKLSIARQSQSIKGKGA
jgi:hypothetical protein